LTYAILKINSFIILKDPLYEKAFTYEQYTKIRKLGLCKKFIPFQVYPIFPIFSE
jgi:hypothetical protein